MLRKKTKAAQLAEARKKAVEEGIAAFERGVDEGYIELANRIRAEREAAEKVKQA